MILDFLYFLRGYLVIKVSGPFIERFINIATKNGILLRKITRGKDSATMLISARGFKKIRSAPLRSAIVSAFIIILSMTISLVGLSNIIKYGYGYCGYLAIAVVVVPFLTVGVYKNRKYTKEHPELKG